MIQLYIEAVNKKDTCIKELDCEFAKTITSVAKWSIETNLVFNTCKTKVMLLTTNQISVWHKP